MTLPTTRLAEETIAADEQATVAEFIVFLQATSTKHHPTGVVPRFNQGRAAGCVDAAFVVLDDLEPDLRVGLFAQPRTYNARIRFAHATSQSDRERDVRGMSIKVLEAASDNLTPGLTDHDFILNSHPIMMVGRTRQFLDLLQAVEYRDGRLRPRLLWVRSLASALSIRFWACFRVSVLSKSSKKQRWTRRNSFASKRSSTR